MLAIAGHLAMNFVMMPGSPKGHSSPLLTTSLFALASLHCLLFLFFSGQLLKISTAVVMLAVSGGIGGALAYFFFLNAPGIGNMP